ncbi:MAG: deoxyribose-phosphate aldolase [Gemmatimonadota bacterium]|nr:MAG: deoxyribose-phosphate aldolase [Gemmatimonadota bacterium]
MKLDDATLEQIIQQITHEVLVLIEQDRLGAETDRAASAASPLSRRNYVDRVQPVVRAGADRIATTLGVAPTDGSLSHLIDHTLLRPDATHEEIAQLCYEARKYGFASVCVNPSYVKLCSDLLKGTDVLTCTVVGFPLGATSTEAKTFEAQKAVRDGADEVDMVINVGALKSRDYELVERDIGSVASAAHAGGGILKVIIEAALLSDEEKVAACQLAKVAGADFVKTSTGFGPGGATAEDVALMRRVVGPQIGVKASGGIRTYADAQRMVEAGATRIGASASVRIVEGTDSEERP